MHLRLVRGDEGFGLVEIVVSMLLLALLALMLAPILIQGLKISAWTTTLATANQLVNQQLAAAQAESPSCAAVIALYDTPAEQEFEVEDPRGVRITVTTTVEPNDPADCPTSATEDLFVKVSAKATRNDEAAKTLVEAETLVFVGIP